MDPAKEIGGDFYDFYLTNDHTLTLVMADVSGKGVPGALFMMVTKILIKEHAMLEKSPAEVLDTINDRICGNNNTNMFVTVWLAKMDLRTGNMIVANAGHDDPAIYKNNGEFELKKTKHGMPLGVRKNRQYEEYEIWMSPGDKIFLYTDGVTEAQTKEEKLFGPERLQKVLNQKKLSLSDTLTQVKKSIKMFVKGAPQSDDITMMILQKK
jgi:sigma-B regulation protein RsbU (phosphoserine phosphatase)